MNFTALGVVGIVIEPPRHDPRFSVLPPKPHVKPTPTVTVTVTPGASGSAGPGGTAPSPTPGAEHAPGPPVRGAARRRAHPPAHLDQRAAAARRRRARPGAGRWWPRWAWPTARRSAPSAASPPGSAWTSRRRPAGSSASTPWCLPGRLGLRAAAATLARSACCPSSSSAAAAAVGRAPGRRAQPGPAAGPGQLRRGPRGAARGGHLRHRAHPVRAVPGAAGHRAPGRGGGRLGLSAAQARLAPGQGPGRRAGRRPGHRPPGPGRHPGCGQRGQQRGAARPGRLAGRAAAVAAGPAGGGPAHPPARLGPRRGRLDRQQRLGPAARRRPPDRPGR